MTSAAADKPVVQIPDGPPPTELVLEDLTVGDGPEAVAGTTCTMQYVGVSWSTGKQFDASWDRGSRSRSASARARSSRAGTRASPA
jgi:peptidylprolyl isomerase